MKEGRKMKDTRNGDSEEVNIGNETKERETVKDGGIKITSTNKEK